MQKTLGIFKGSTRSHSSLLSSQNPQQDPREREHQQLHHRRGSHQSGGQSIDSPLASPTSPGSNVTTQTAASTTFGLVPVYRKPDRSSRKQSLTTNTKPDHGSNNNNSNNTQQKPKTLQKLRRSQSQRNQRSNSPPSDSAAAANLVGAPTTQANRTSIEDDDSDHYDHSTQHYEHKKIPEHKKKRRFFGLGDTSTSPDAHRDPSTKGGVSPRPRIITTLSPSPQPRNEPLSANYPSPATGEESEEEEFVTKTLYRHSVAFTGHPLTTNYSPSTTTYSPESGQDSPSSQIHSPSFNTASSQSHSLEQGGSHKPAWERIGRSVGPHHRNASSDQQAPSLHPSLSTTSSASIHKSKPELSFPEPSHSSNSRPPSRQSLEPPSPAHTLQGPFHHRGPSIQSTSSLTEGSMGPPSSQQHSSSRSLEASQQNTQLGSSREGQYGSTLSVNNQQAGSYRNTPQSSPMVQEGSNSGQGRSTPPPSKSRDDLASLDVQQLLSRHEELNDKYRKVKKYYFDKDAQVQQLQNTLAHQRLAQSRTSLDDNEYANRFARLDGAINNLAFNIRKEWRAVPPWLAPYVNKDATTTVTKEMTAVGRACISRWLVDEIFDRYFHPALEPNLSSHLKIIERNLRRFAPPTPTEEEREALLAKISNWRLASLDGLQDMLNTHEAAEYRAGLTKALVDMLTSDLMLNLKEPPPPGLEAGVVGIIELAVGIAANLPLESRDVFIDYIMPGTIVNESYMKVEGALPALTNPGEGQPDMDRASLGSLEDKDDDDQSKDQSQGKQNKGMFGKLIGGGAKKNPTSGPRADTQPTAPKEDRVRFAAFMSVEVRGKNMLIKAPVYV